MIRPSLKRGTISNGMDENEKQLNANKDIKVLRTYTSDMADAIRTNEISVIKIALAEKEKREQQELYKKAEGTGFSKTLLIIGGIILIAAAIAGSYFLVQKKKEKEVPKQTINNVETFISYDAKSYIDVTKINNVINLSNAIKNEAQLDSNLVKAIFLTNTINSGEPAFISTNNFLSLIQSTAPGALTRSLSDKYLLGKYSDQTRKGTFLILQTTDYNQAYASMLDWEKTMLKDLYAVFDLNIVEYNNPIFEKEWKDIVVNNKDARVLYGENGEGLLYYTFVNKNDFIIANNIDTLKEIISRLITKNIK